MTSTLRFRGWLLAIALAQAALLAGSFGCGGGSSKVSETHVGREETYRTGNFDYDEFFEDVTALQASAKNASEDEKTARAPLSRELGITEGSLDRVLEDLKTKADELAQSKNRIHLVVDNVDDKGLPLPGKTVAVTPTAAKGKFVTKDAAEFANALQQTAKMEGQVWEKYGPLPDKGRRLSEKADALRGSVPADFASAPKAKRDEVLRELEAAKLICNEIAQRCGEVVGTATKFLKQGGDALNAAATAEIKQAPPPPSKTTKGKGTKSTAKPSAEKPAPEKPQLPEKPQPPEKSAEPHEKPAPPEKSAPPEKPAAAAKPAAKPAPAEKAPAAAKPKETPKAATKPAPARAAPRPSEKPAPAEGAGDFNP